jgi:hypothetical protein
VLKLAVAGLDLVVQKLEAHLVGPPPLPEGDQADPDPVSLHPLTVVAEAAAVDERTSHLFSGQRALAQPFQAAAVQIQAEAAQLGQELVVTQVSSTKAQRPVAAFNQAADLLVGEHLLLADPVQRDP